jgi:general secretion pathway protein H
MVVALVAPRLPSTDSSALRSSARALAGALRYLGESSTTAKTNYRLHLNISANSLKINRRLPSGDEVPPDDRLFARKILGDRVFISDVQTSRLGKVTEGEVLIDFNAAGLTEYLTIHLSSGPGKDFTVVGFPNNGKVKVLEGYQEFSL